MPTNYTQVTRTIQRIASRVQTWIKSFASAFLTQLIDQLTNDEAGSQRPPTSVNIYDGTAARDGAMPIKYRSKCPSTQDKLL